MQPATCMGTIQEKVLAYGLGDDGYGIVYLQEDFRMYETCMGKEKNQRSVAKTTLIPTFNEVSNAEYAEFVSETSHKTEAETFGDSFVMDKYLSPKTLSTIEQVIQ